MNTELSSTNVESDNAIISKTKKEEENGRYRYTYRVYVVKCLCSFFYKKIQLISINRTFPKKTLGTFEAVF